VKFRFTIGGMTIGGDKPGIKMWLEKSIMDYNQMPQFVSDFEVDLEEIDN
jgi:hypothetical protein